VNIWLFGMEDDDDKVNSLTLWGKGTWKNVITPTLKTIFERCNKDCEIGGADISYLGIGV
jgi:hypothetical protein